MSTVASSGSPAPETSRSPSRLFVGLLLAAGTAVSAFALALALRRTDTLRALPDSVYGRLVATLVLATVVGAYAIARRMRGRRDGHGGPGPPPEWARVRAWVYVFLAGMAVYLVAFQPFKPLLVVLFEGAWLGLFALLDLLWDRFGRAAPRGFARALDRGLLALAVLAVGLELGLRGASRVSSARWLARATDPADMMERYRLPPGTRLFGFEVDARGYHDEPLDPARPGPRFVTIGDSFSVGVVPHAFHYTTVAERALGEGQIYNVGISACGPPEYLRMLAEDALPLEPDAVVLAIFVGNDVAGAEHFGTRVTWLRSWFAREEWLLDAVPRRLVRVRAERRRAAEERNGAAPAPHTNADENAFVPTPAACVERFPWLADPALETPTFTPTAFLEIETGRALQLCRSGPAFYRGFFAFVEEARRLAGETPLLFLLLPDEFQVNDALWSEVLARTARVGELERDRAQRVLGDGLRAAGLPFLDLLPVLRAVPPGPDGERHLYHLRDTHLNARGNDAVGRALAEFLREHFR